MASTRVRSATCANLRWHSRTILGCATPAWTLAEDKAGMLAHAERALALGATESELLQALRIANGIGLHGISEGVKAIEEPIRRFAAV